MSIFNNLGDPFDQAAKIIPDCGFTPEISNVAHGIGQSNDEVVAAESGASGAIPDCGVTPNISDVAHGIGQAIDQGSQTAQGGLDGHVLAQPTVVQHMDPDILATLNAAAGPPQAEHYTAQYGILGGTPPIAIYDDHGHIFIPSQGGSQTFGGTKGEWSGPVDAVKNGSQGSGTEDHVETHPGNTGIAPVVHTELDPTTGKITVTGPSGADPIPSSEGGTATGAHQIPGMIGDVTVSDKTGLPANTDTQHTLSQGSTAAETSGHTGSFWEQAAQVVSHHLGDGGKGLGSAVGSILDTISHMNHGQGLGEVLNKLSASGLPHWIAMAEEHAGLGGHGEHGHFTDNASSAHVDFGGEHFAHNAHLDLHLGHGHP